MSGHRKVFVSQERLMLDSVRLARQMYDKRYRPDTILGIWRGGTAVAIYVTGALKRLGVNHKHFSATGKSYNQGIENQSSVVNIYNMEELAKTLRETKCRRLCCVDDVFDTGITYDAFRRIVQEGLIRRLASASHKIVDGELRQIELEDAVKRGSEEYTVYDFEVRVNGGKYTLRIPMVDDIAPINADVNFAAPYQKSQKNRTDYKPKFCVYDWSIEGSPWINFPYELEADDITDSELWDERPEVAKILLGEAV